MSRLRRIDPAWALVAALSIVAVAPLSAPGFFYGAHDATIGAYFLAQFDKGLADGALYPRWAIDWTFGYGYPVFIVIAPLAFYVAELFNVLGAGIIGALKITYALALVCSGWSMYLLGRELFGRTAGVLAAVLYVYAPYHLVDIYVRGDLAEFAVFAFFPAILWAIVRAGRAATRRAAARDAALGALLYGGLILTHITMAMIFTPLALAFALLACTESGAAPRRARPQRLLAAAAVIALGIGIGAAYLLPGVIEQRYLKAQDLVGGYYGYANHYVYPHQLLSPMWDFGYAAIGPGDQMPLQLGVLAVVLALCSLWALPRLAALQRRHAAFFLGMSALVVFAMLSASQPLWDVFSPFLSFVQFPWRLLSLTTLTLALAGASIVSHVECDDSSRRQAAALLVALAILASYPYVAPQYRAGEISLPNMIQFQLDTGEMLGDTIWVTERPTGSPMVSEYMAGTPPTRAVADDARAAIEVLHSGGASFEVHVTAPAATDVLFHIRYFPGWTAYLDGARVQPEIRAPQGLLAVGVPAGEHRVRLRFEDTPLRFGTKIVSLLSIALTVAMLLWSRRGTQ